MTIQEFEQIIKPIPAATFAKTMERLLLVDARLALEAKRQAEQNAASTDAGAHQANIEALTAEINEMQTRIDAL